MPIIEKSIRLQVPAESVFQYLGEPGHFTKFCENIIEISDVQRHPQKNTKFAWVYSMMGVHIFGKAEIEVAKHDQQLNVRFWGGIQGMLAWQLQPSGEEIRLRVSLDYAVPTPLLKKHSEDAIFIRMNMLFNPCLQICKSRWTLTEFERPVAYDLTQMIDVIRLTGLNHVSGLPAADLVLTVAVQPSI